MIGSVCLNFSPEKANFDFAVATTAIANRGCLAARTVSPYRTLSQPPELTGETLGGLLLRAVCSGSTLHAHACGACAGGFRVGC